MSTAADSPKLPFHLRGNFAPVEKEVTAFDLPVEGALPPELRGLYLRNGPNPRGGSSPHWFTGDGMVHGVCLEDGAARWYRNRWVRTRYLTEDDPVFIDEEGRRDLGVGRANTNVVGHAGRILALVESSLPTELTPELDTVGPYDFDGRLATPMTAHPKRCPATGEMHFFGYSFAPPFCTYHVADREGRLVHSEEIPVRGPTMMHDFAITAEHALFLDLPVVFQPERLEAGLPYGWSDDYGARVGVMPRRGKAADLRWFEIEPCYVFHPLNAYTEGSRVVLDVARYPELWRDHNADFRTARLHRIVLDLDGGGAREEPLDERGVEFPRVDPRREGRPHRFGYAVHYRAGPDEVAVNALLQYDLTGGACREHHFGEGCVPGEGVFVPAGPDAAEDEGWVLAFVYDEARHGSELAVLDASRFEAPPVARIRLPQRVPFGFHGNWLPRPA